MLERLVGRNAAKVLAFGIDKLDLGNANFPVGARPVLNRGIGFEWSADGRILLDCFGTAATHRGRPACGRRQCRDRYGEVNSIAARKNHLLSYA
jgi:hypothetical protein